MPEPSANMKFSAALKFRKNFAILSLIMTPVLFLIADLMTFFNDAPFLRTVVTRMALAFFIPAMLTLTHLLRERADYMGLFGSGLGTLGCLAGVSVSAVNLVQQALTNEKFDGETVRSVEKVFNDESFWRGVILFPYPGLALPLALIVFGIGLFRTKVVSRWVSVLLIFAAPLFLGGRVMRSWSSSFVCDLLLLIAMGLVAWQIFSWVVDQWVNVPTFGEQKQNSP